ncbi:hypothetical protein FT173_014635 [Bordetella pertussis]
MLKRAENTLTLSASTLASSPAGLVLGYSFQNSRTQASRLVSQNTVALAMARPNPASTSGLSRIMSSCATMPLLNSAS